MKVKINPKIIINEPVKNKCYGFKIILSKKDTNQLTVKARSFDGRSRGVAGKITRQGFYTPANAYKSTLPFICKDVQKKVDLLLDLVFGVNRDKSIKLCKKGLVHFNNK